MRKCLAVLAALCCAASARAQGVLVSSEPGQPLALVRTEVNVAIEEQVAVTRVEQTFRNDSGRQLEATYVFPVPKGASVRKFSMWVDGKEVKGELVEADKARQIYTSIVERTKDPGLLEYAGNNLLRVRVFPVPPHGDQKVMVSYTSVSDGDNGVIEYTYPLRGESKSLRPLDKFTLSATVKSQHAVHNVYSPSHAVKVDRVSDRSAKVGFEATQQQFDRDFQLYYTSGGKDVGLTALTHRPHKGEDGYVLLLISPRAELSRTQEIPRDMVFVMDTSGSMAGKRIIQARDALKFCLRNLGAKDRFAVLNFATVVNKYRDSLLPATRGNVEQASAWADKLEAIGSTNINDALLAALAMRPGDEGRSFTVVFFTDGQPTVSEVDPQRILANVTAKNTANTRIFTFGVGDDVNAVLLDQLAEKTRSVATYVRESEDIEAKVSSLYGKISHPVLTDLKLTAGGGVKLSEIYPPQLPDLFHGSQLVVLARYKGKGDVKLTLSGRAGAEAKEFPYEVKFPGHTKDGRTFVEDLWARRKVGYLLDQIRVNGSNKELTDEVVSLAKKYGITTPYTSYLVVPDVAVAGAPQMQPPVAGGANGTYQVPPALGAIPPGSVDAGFFIAGEALTSRPANGAAAPAAGRVQFAPVFVSPAMTYAVPNSSLTGPAGPVPTSAPSVAEKKARMYFESMTDAEDPSVQIVTAPDGRMVAIRGFLDRDGSIASALGITATATAAPASVAGVSSGKAGVDLSVQLSELRTQTQVAGNAVKQAAGRKLADAGGAWIDTDLDAKAKVVRVKAMSPAYFRILARQPQMSEVFRLGQRVVWMTPSGSALVVDPSAGAEQMSDADIDALFVAKP